MRFLKSPVFYLVASNFVFWGLPLILIQFRAGEPVAQLDRPEPVLARISADIPEPIGRDPLLSTEVPAAPAADPNSSAIAPTIAPVPALPRSVALQRQVVADSPNNLMRELEGAAGLGGPITLESLKEPLMPIAARVERQQQKQSGDRLAALPRHWRDSLRRELPATRPVSEATLVRLPVPALKQRQEVPVIVNEQGEGEALVEPQDPRVRQAVEGWAARQMAARPGTVQVYVVAAEPLSGETP